MIFIGLFNTFGVRFLGYVNNFSVWWHARQFSISLIFSLPFSHTRLDHTHLPAPLVRDTVGTTSIVIAVLIKAPTHQSAKFVFATFIDGTGVDDAVGWSQRASPAYVAIIGILLAQYTLTGYDASAHVSIQSRLPVHNNELACSLVIFADVRRDPQCC